MKTVFFVILSVRCWWSVLVEAQGAGLTPSAASIMTGSGDWLLWSTDWTVNQRGQTEQFGATVRLRERGRVREGERKQGWDRKRVREVLLPPSQVHLNNCYLQETTAITFDSGASGTSPCSLFPPYQQQSMWRVTYTPSSVLVLSALKMTRVTYAGVACVSCLSVWDSCSEGLLQLLSGSSTALQGQDEGLSPVWWVTSVGSRQSSYLGHTGMKWVENHLRKYFDRCLPGVIMVASVSIHPSSLPSLSPLFLRPFFSLTPGFIILLFLASQIRPCTSCYHSKYLWLSPFSVSLCTYKSVRVCVLHLYSCMYFCIFHSHC